MNQPCLVYLRAPKISDKSEVIDAYRRSADFHNKWTCIPRNLDQYLTDEHRYFVCLRETDQIVGTYHISGIIRGWFQSGYLAYEAFVPHQKKGYMALGLKLVLEDAFESLNLHRLEANIQPDNLGSIRLVSAAGFVKEGFSRSYLRVGGKDWKDHERWAILNADWSET